MGHVDRAFQCVFALGNERSLLSLLSRLNCAAAWPRLSEADARYLVRLLVRLLCKDPLGRPAEEACFWLEALAARTPGGVELLGDEDLSALHGALFSFSGTPGAVGRSATCLYHVLWSC